MITVQPVAIMAEIFIFRISLPFPNKAYRGLSTGNDN